PVRARVPFRNRRRWRTRERGTSTVAASVAPFGGILAHPRRARQARRPSNVEPPGIACQTRAGAGRFDRTACCLPSRCPRRVDEACAADRLLGPRMMRIASVRWSVLTLALALSAGAADAPPSDASAADTKAAAELPKLAVEQYELDNGLTVIL